MASLQEQVTQDNGERAGEEKEEGGGSEKEEEEGGGSEEVEEEGGGSEEEGGEGTRESEITQEANDKPQEVEEKDTPKDDDKVTAEPEQVQDTSKYCTKSGTYVM